MQRALQAVKRLAKPRPCPNTSFLRRLPELLLGAAPALSVCAHAQISATRSSSAGTPASTHSMSLQPQSAAEHSASQVDFPHKVSSQSMRLLLPAVKECARMSIRAAGQSRPAVHTKLACQRLSIRAHHMQMLERHPGVMHDAACDRAPGEHTA